MEVSRDGESMRGPSIALGCLAIASVVALDPSAWSPFGPAKWWAVSTIGFGAAGWALWRGRTPVDRTTARLWGALLTWLTVAAILGDDVRTALLGQPDRHLGVLTFGVFALLFVAGQQVWHDGLTTVARGAVIAALGLGAYTCWELAFGRPIAVATATDRLLGPYGSAAFLAAAATLATPIAAGLALDRQQPTIWRAVAGVAAMSSAVALVGSGTRGALVAAGVTLIAAVVVRRPSRRVIGIGAGLVMAAILAIAPRLGDVLERTEGADSRLDEWRVAVHVIARHPLVGVGPEGYRIAVAEGVDLAYERAHPRTTTQPDRAHSGPLDMALAGGLPAAVLHLALLGLVGRAAVRVLRRRGADGSSIVDVGVAAGVLAYGLQQLVLFPLADVDPIWWCAAGLVVAAERRVSQPRPPETDAGDAVLSAPASLQLAPRRAIASLAMIAAVAAFVSGMLDAAADRTAKTALLRSADGDPDGAGTAAERATELRPDSTRYRLVAAHVLLDAGTLADVDAALAQLADAAGWSPSDPLVVEATGDALLQLARITGDDDDVAAAFAHWRAAVDHDPHRTTWQLELGRAAALAGDRDAARHAWTAALLLAPRDPTAASLLAALDEVQP